MNIFEQEAGKYIGSLIEGGLHLQGLRITSHWEPRLVAIMGGCAGQALQKVQESLSGFPVPEQAQRYLVQDIISLTDRALKEGKDLLIEMVSQEVTASGEIITMQGLFGDPASLDLERAAGRNRAEAIAGGQALYEKVIEGRNWFVRSMIAALDDSARQGHAPEFVLERITKLVRDWQISLERSARTLLHGVANRTRRAVSEAMQ